jgi:hypothetical protein
MLNDTLRKSSIFLRANCHSTAETKSDWVNNGDGADNGPK